MPIHAATRLPLPSEATCVSDSRIWLSPVERYFEASGAASGGAASIIGASGTAASGGCAESSPHAEKSRSAMAIPLMVSIVHRICPGVAPACVFDLANFQNELKI